MTEQEYRAHPAISQSALKKILVSPAHFQWCQANPTEPTEAMVMGTLLHAMVLEQHCNYRKRPAIYKDFRTKAAQEWRDDPTQSHLPVISEEQEQRLYGMNKSLREHAAAGAIIEASEKEVVGFSDLLFPKKGRADLIYETSSSTLVGADIKKVAVGCANERDFARAMSDFEYAFQAAFYCTIFGLAKFVFIVVEDQPSEAGGRHIVEVFEPDDDTMRFGHEQVKRACAVYFECTACGLWPGRPDKDENGEPMVKTIRLPEYRLISEGK